MNFIYEKVSKCISSCIFWMEKSCFASRWSNNFITVGKISEQNRHFTSSCAWLASGSTHSSESLSSEKGTVGMLSVVVLIPRLTIYFTKWMTVRQHNTSAYDWSCFHPRLPWLENANGRDRIWLWSPDKVDCVHGHKWPCCPSHDRYQLNWTWQNLSLSCTRLI